MMQKVINFKANTTKLSVLPEEGERWNDVFQNWDEISSI